VTGISGRGNRDREYVKEWTWWAERNVSDRTHTYSGGREIMTSKKKVGIKVKNMHK
jgi:hypothetical protein